MASRALKHSRTWHRARRTQRVHRQSDPQGTPHQRAIRRLAMELKAREGIMGLFHAGVTWRAFACLVSLATAVAVETEKPLKLGNSRFVPDLIVRCARTHQILLVVEVWHTHAVSAKKKAAFQVAGFSWVEVRSWHVISRTRRQPLPILDWAGPGLPRPPEQYPLFEFEDGQKRSSEPSVHDRAPTKLAPDLSGQSRRRRLTDADQRSIRSDPARGLPSEVMIVPAGEMELKRTFLKYCD